jgi:hypothetical protein
LRVKGYNGLHGADITHYTLLNLTVDDRIQSFTPFLITRLGTRTVILGRSWLAENRILLNCAQRKLYWPPDLPPMFSYAKNTEVLLRSSDCTTVNRYHQYDAARRDRKLDEYWSKQPERPLRTTSTLSANLIILCRPASPVRRPSEADYKPQTPVNSCELLSTPATSSIATFKKDTDAALRRMEKDLKSSLPPTPPTPKRRPKPLWQPKATRTPAAIEIRPISGTALNFICKNYADYELFSVTMQEVDSLLDQKREQKQGRDDLNSLIAQLLASTDRKAAIYSILNLEAAEPPVPDKYKDYAHVFSKAESNILPPHRLYDHKIQLEADGASSLCYSPLYKISAKELETVKEYLTDNLAKGFIEPSQVPFAAPVLFVKKPNGSLRFCIDFCALNALTRKDRYPLPLIDETLARIASAKVFTKLDIRQVFHWIRMDPDSEEYTTFRTRYGAYKCKVMPFGLTNGPATYQRYMNDVLFDYLDVFCTAYLDDILIYSDNELEYTA